MYTDSDRSDDDDVGGGDVDDVLPMTSVSYKTHCMYSIDVFLLFIFNVSWF